MSTILLNCQERAAHTRCEQFWHRTGTNQLWTADLVGSLTGSKYILANVNSGLAVGVEDASTTAGAHVVQLTGTGTTSEQWTMS
jgi:hypothetical protein